MLKVFALFSLLISSSVAAQDLSTFAKILIPVLNQSQEIVGPNGAKFTTDLGMLSYPRDVIYYPGPGEQPTVSARIGQITPLYVWEAPVVARGRFIFVEPAAESLPIWASVSALTPDGKRAITPLPVVRERDLRAGATTLGLIPNDGLYGPLAGSNTPPFLGYRQRHTIRIYDFDTIGGVTVSIRMRFASWLDRGVIAEKTVLLSSRDFDDSTYPFYFEANLQQLFGDRWCFQGPRPGCQSFGAIIEVEPLAPNTRYYAFISTTENDTNHVSIYEAR